MHGDAVGGQPASVVNAFGQRGGLRQQTGQGTCLCAEGRIVEHRGDFCTGLGVLIGDEIQQRTAAGEHHALTDGATLEFQGDLRSAEAVDPWQRPARHRKNPVGGAGGDDHF
ncbi:hypothetical protein D3C84_663230 [compost metagenome]